MSKAVVFFAEGTEECEALLVVDLLRRAKVEVIVASAMGRRELVSSHKIHLTADALAEEVDYSDVDMVVLPGGIPGTPNLAANKTVTETCAAFAKAGRKVAAICAAPSILASLGLLEGRNATAHAGFQDQVAQVFAQREQRYRLPGRGDRVTRVDRARQHHALQGQLLRLQPAQPPAHQQVAVGVRLPAAGVQHRPAGGARPIPRQHPTAIPSPCR
mgnify:CR=1 FL=1